MKKRVVALLLGGLMAVGGLSLQIPVTVEAVSLEECEWSTAAHVESYEVTTIDGELAVKIEVNEFEGDVTQEQAGFSMFALEKRFDTPTRWLPIAEELVATNYPEGSCLYANTESGTYTFSGLAANKTYYVYCIVFDHDWGPESAADHDVICLGSGTPTVCKTDKPAVENPPAADTPSTDTPAASTPAASVGKAKADPYKIFESNLASQIKAAEPGSTIVLDGSATTLSNAVMKELLKKGDVSLRMEFTYNEEEYVILIPAGAALDNDIPWYGPLYLAQQFGNSAGGDNADAADAAYTVKPGDTLGRIAAANHMTLRQLLEKNPQIKDANKIVAGQKLNL